MVTPTGCFQKEGCPALASPFSRRRDRSPSTPHASCNAARQTTLDRELGRTL